MPKRASLDKRPLFESRWGLRLFWCGRWVSEPFGPASLSRGRIAFDFVEKGRQRYEINGRVFDLRAGDLIVLREGNISRQSRVGPTLATMLSLGLALDQGDQANVLLHRDFAPRYSLKKPREYIRRFDRVLSALTKPKRVQDWALSAALLDLIVFVEETTAPSLLMSPDSQYSLSERIRMAQSWAQSRLASPFALADWAGAVELHPGYFCRLFLRHIGLTPMQWLKEQRMQAARQYLVGTARTVNEIARAVGYEDAAYFSRVFHQSFGRSPLQYRRINFRV